MARLVLLPAVTVARSANKERAMPRCRDCGYLAARQNSAAPVLVEVGFADRENWSRGFVVIAPGPPIRDTFAAAPVCFVMARKFEEELKGEQSRSNVNELLKEEWNCPSFTPWNQGFSPKEHKEMMMTEQIQRLQNEQRESDRRWQQEQKARELAWQEEQREKDRRWQEEQNRKGAHRQFWNVIIGGAIAFLGGIVMKAIIG
jgi:hypothetical protein